MSNGSLNPGDTIESNPCPRCEKSCEKIEGQEQYYCPSCQIRFRLSADGKTLSASWSGDNFDENDIRRMAERWALLHKEINLGEPDWNAFYVDAENRLAACEAELAKARNRIKELEKEKP